MKRVKLSLRPFAMIMVVLGFAMVVTHDIIYGAEDTKKITSAMPEVVVRGQQDKKSYKPTTVSSTKYTEPIRDIPQTIQVVPEAVMKDQNATSLREVLRNVPGISIQAGEGGVPAGDQLSIRGFSARTDFFVDGIRDIGGYTRDPFAFEQIEVVKGPSSSFAGRGATGGLINMVSKMPQLRNFYKGSYGYGTDEYQRATIDVNQQIEGVEGAAVRVNSMIFHTDTPGRKVAENQRWGISPTIALGMGTATRLKAGVFHMHQNNIPDYGIPWIPAGSDRGALAGMENYPAPVDYNNFYGLSGRDYEKINTTMVTAEFQHDFNDSLTFRDLFRYGRNYRDSLITAPRFVPNSSTLIRRSDEKSRDQVDSIFANQMELISQFETFDLKHKLVAGIEYNYENDTNYDRQPTGPDSPSTDLFSPDPSDPYLENYARTGHKATAKANTLSLYSFDTIAVTDWLDVNGGLRWDYFNVAFGPNTGDSLHRVDYPLSWNAGIVYKPVEIGSIYFGYGVSFNPSAEGLTLSASTPPTGANPLSNPIDADPEKTRTFEIGTKWDVLQEKLQLNAAVFHTTKTNARTQDAADPSDLTVLEGRQRIMGVELGAAGSVTKDWRVFTGYTFLNSRVLESKTAAEIDKDLSNTPSHSFSLWSTYDLPWDFQVGGGLNYVDRRFNSNTNTRKAPSYLLFDAMASYKFREHFTFRFNIYNITNEKYIGSVGGGHFIPGPGRSMVFSTDVDFD